VTRGKYLQLTLALLFLYGSAWATDLDLGGFGNALLLGAVVFGIMALSMKSTKGSEDG
jgi:hypothetical protein